MLKRNHNCFSINKICDEFCVYQITSTLLSYNTTQFLSFNKAEYPAIRIKYPSRNRKLTRSATTTDIKTGVKGILITRISQSSKINIMWFSLWLFGIVNMQWRLLIKNEVMRWVVRFVDVEVQKCRLGIINNVYNADETRKKVLKTALRRYSINRSIRWCISWGGAPFFIHRDFALSFSCQKIAKVPLGVVMILSVAQPHSVDTIRCIQSRNIKIFILYRMSKIKIPTIGIL